MAGLNCHYVFCAKAFCASRLSIKLALEMGDLTQLPFPPSELSWSKLPVVMEHLGLSKAQAATVVQLVLGAPSVFWQYNGFKFY